MPVRPRKLSFAASIAVYIQTVVMSVLNRSPILGIIAAIQVCTELSPQQVKILTGISCAVRRPVFE